jgi:hypothetical protein
MAGIDGAAVTAALKQAYGPTRGIETAARNIAVPEFGERLSRIIDIGQDFTEIERDPRDAARAKRFLNIYLDSAERVTTEYAKPIARSAAVRSNRTSVSCWWIWKARSMRST